MLRSSHPSRMCGVGCRRVRRESLGQAPRERRCTGAGGRAQYRADCSSSSRLLCYEAQECPSYRALSCGCLADDSTKRRDFRTCSAQSAASLMSILLSVIICFPLFPLGASSASAAAAPAATAAVASAGEDQAKLALRKIDSALESSLGALLQPGSTATSSQSEAHAACEWIARGPLAPQEGVALIKEVWELVDQVYADVRGSGFSREKWQQLRDEALSRSLPDRAAAERVVRRMLAEGVADPYTRYLSRGEFQEMLKYDVTGIGLNLGSLEDLRNKTGMDGDDASGIYVLGLVAEGAGAKAGIAQGDRILALDGTSLVGKTPFQAASDIAAATGPALRLEVQSCGEPPRLLTVRKPESAAPKSPVESYMTESKFGRGRRVGYVRLSSLNALAQRDVSAAVRSLESNGAEEIVLDLRDNRGGLVSEGVEVAGLFLDEGDRVVLTEGTRTPRDPQTAGGKPLTRLPVTVLVSGRTASAAEILAGAIKDNCRGVVVGERTYGKGLIQSVFELADGSGLVVTVGRYLTPSGTDIDLTGVLPDFRSVPSREQAEGRLKLCRAER